MFWKEDMDLDLILLKSTNNPYELDTIKALLEEAGIPYILHNKGSGAYMRIIGGRTIYATDILVEKSALQEAEKILADFKEGRSF